MKSKKLFITFAVLTAAATAFIFGNSLMDGETSSQASGFFSGIVKNLLEFFGFEPDADTVSYAVRKTAHFSEYCLLSAVAWLALYFLKGKLRLCFASVGYSAAVAFADEFIMQRITAGRSPQITDVLIDCYGALLAASVCTLIFYLRGKHNKKRGTQT